MFDTGAAGGEMRGSFAYDLWGPGGNQLSAVCNQYTQQLIISLVFFTPDLFPSLKDMYHEMGGYK
jgi:hypothetical protein